MSAGQQYFDHPTAMQNAVKKLQLKELEINQKCSCDPSVLKTEYQFFKRYLSVCILSLQTAIQMKDFSYITNSSPAFIENLYQEFVKDPNSVDPEMKKFFEGFDFAVGNGATGTAITTNGSGAAHVAVSKAASPGEVDPIAIGWRKELGAYRMILGYRNKGHLIAKTNPIRERKDRDANLNLDFFWIE